MKSRTTINDIMVICLSSLVFMAIASLAFSVDDDDDDDDDDEDDNCTRKRIKSRMKMANNNKHTK